MSKKAKLIEKVFTFGDITFQEAEKLLNSLGYESEFPNGGSSHKTFRKAGQEKITLVSTQRPLKRYAIKMIQEILRKEGF